MKHSIYVYVYIYGKGDSAVLKIQYTTFWTCHITKLNVNEGFYFPKKILPWFNE